MDKFPDDLNRQTCMLKLERNQAQLLKSVRKTFYDTINQSIENCDLYVKLEFPEKLWKENRLIVIKELLQQFGQMKVKTISTHVDVIKPITMNDTLIPDNIKLIIIEFIKTD